MNNEKKQFLIWITIAGILMMIVGVHDLLFMSTAEKSGFMIALELVAGLAFLLNALFQWRKTNNESEI